MNVPQFDIIIIDDDDYEESVDDTQDIIDNHDHDVIDEGLIPTCIGGNRSIRNKISKNILYN